MTYAAINGSIYAPRDDAKALQWARRCVLVVDDEPIIRTVRRVCSDRFGLRGAGAADGVGALEYLRSGKDIDLLVTDMRLPGMSGRQIADAARELRPRLKVLFVTGFADSAALSPQNLQPGMEVMNKPFRAEALAERVTRMTRM